MRQAHLTWPDLGLIAGTRAALGAGIGLLLCDQMSPEQRRAVGWTLFAVGAISTVPLIGRVWASGASGAFSADGGRLTAAR